ncbi:class E sortase [Microbacterium karelineae]|uniref:class E sortase n=1 Tax=Microbacterium karelineae TaxID=2654283 RepID=UPI001E64FAFE|nr:class E sortase [Microbacterium karelineae]
MSIEAKPLPRPRRVRRRATFASVLGELLLTVGVVILLFISWQLWIGDLIIGEQNNLAGAEQIDEWSRLEIAPPPVTEDPATGEQWYEPPTLEHPGEGEVFATMRVPRWGDDYKVNIAGGTTRSVTLDHIGIGLYTESKMPGEVGNFAVAAHRTTFGKPFADISTLQIGDAIVVEAPEGWFTYRYRSLEYVVPSQLDVLADVPRMPDVESNGTRYITLTSCSPKFSLAERIIGYGVFESFTPRSEGEPDSLESVS